MLEHGTRRVVAAHAGSNIEAVLEQVRAAKSVPVVIALDALSIVFATPEHFRMLDGVRAGTAGSVTFAVDDPHRTGLALAFGYRVQPLSSVTTQREPTHPVVTRMAVGNMYGAGRRASRGWCGADRGDARTPGDVRSVSRRGTVLPCRAI